MKKIKLITAVLVFFAAFNLTSCDNEPIDPAINLNNGGNNGGNTGGGGTTTGDYWPAALNNQWVFNLNGVQQTPMKIVSINAINGNTYYTFNQQTGSGGTGTSGTSATIRLRKTNGDYYIKVEDIVTPAQAGGIPGSTTTGSETILLKDYLAVGGTWTSSYTQTTTYTDPSFPVISLGFVIDASIVEKNISLTVNGAVYTDVIKVKYVQNVTSFGQTTSSINYYWFSKNVGPIKITNEFGTDTYNQELASYILN